MLISADIRHLITFDGKVVEAWKLVCWIQREILLFIDVSHVKFERVKSSMIF